MPPAAPGDTCGVVYASWTLASDVNDQVQPAKSSIYPKIVILLSSSVMRQPTRGLSSAPASDNGGEMTKLKAGDTKAEPVMVKNAPHAQKARCLSFHIDLPFQGLANAVVGMRAKAQRLFVVASLDPSQAWTLVSIHLVKHKKVRHSDLKHFFDYPKLKYSLIYRRKRSR
jgi:hypothetical protein